MSNDYYTHTGFPAPSSDGKSVDQRAELLAIQAAFDKMPPLTASKLIISNSAGSGLTSVGKYLIGQSWTPALTCVTPGNLTIAYSTQIGEADRIGQLVHLKWRLVTSTWTHTTASGTLFMVLPFTPAFSANPIGALAFQGFTKANYTQLVPIITNSLQFRASGSGQTLVTAAVTDFPTAGSVILEGEIWYTTNDA